MKLNGFIHRTVIVVCMCFVWSGILFSARAVGGTQPVEELIHKAGNTEDEQVRLKLLKELQQSPALTDSTLKKDLGELVESIERWNNTRHLPYFRPTKEFRIDMSEISPLYPLLCFYRGRQLAWHTIGASGTWGGGWENIDTARALFSIAARAFPENRIIRMYLGEPIPVKKQYPPNPKAPRWANLHRECLERLTDAMEWWIDNRQQSDGSFGGGWGDDVEFWRVWYSAVIPFEDPKLVNAQAKLAWGVWSQEHMSKGYTSKMSDVEHTAEDSADTLSPMILLEPDNPEWSKRTMKIADLMENVWMGRNERGLLQFKGIYFNVDEVQAREACDTFYHTRVAHPVMFLWLRTADPKLSKLIGDWMSTWVDAARRAENGKPAGVLPCSISWPTGKVGGPRSDWWNPINYTAKDTNYYTFPSQLSQMCRCLVLAYHMTGDEKFIEPLRTMARIYLKYINDPAARESAVPGSEAWCAQNIDGIIPALAKYRLLTGNNEFDDLLLREADPIITHRLKGDMAPIVDALENNAKFMRVNFEAYTSEMRCTDRLFMHPHVFGHWGKDDKTRKAGIRQFNRSIIYQTATGDPGDLLYFPLMAVRWLTPPRKIAVFVSDSGPDRFKAELFHFGTKPRKMGVELYVLKPGVYEMILRDSSNAELNRQKILVKDSRTRISFKIPPQMTCTITVKKLSK
ncbi:MAG: hypothetical protein ACYTBP_10790 [Planctomycetota bacterium]|jgi:hypothetical protein